MAKEGRIILILSRQRSESIVIGEGKDRIIVTVVSVQGGRVRLSFEAAPEVHIVRSELREQK